MNLFFCCSSSDNSNKQQLAQDKVHQTQKNFGVFTAIPLQEEIDAYSKTGGVDKKALATAATIQKMYEKKCLTVHKPFTITPYRASHTDRVNDMGQLSVEIIEDQISPTCLRTLKNVDSNLENIYVATDKEKFISGRTGIIDTRKKAQQFNEIVQNQLAKLPKMERVARVVSHQLNSPESEGRMIENQHCEMALLNVKNQTYKVAHLNTPSNVLYDYTIYIRKIPYIGWLLSGIMEVFLYGEKESKEQNIEGLARMALWLKEDLAEYSAKAILLDQELEDIELSLGVIAEFQLNRLDKSITETDKEGTKNARTLLKTGLRDYYKNLKTLNLDLQKEISEGNQDLKLIQEKVALMQMILGDQLDIEGQELDRGCLNMAIGLLNSRLGVLGFINCKSGLDRTGYLFAVKTAMTEMERDGENLFDMVTQWSPLTSALNKSSIPTVDHPSSNEIVDNWIQKSKIKSNHEINDQIFTFRLKVFENLRSHGLDATARSTGVFGFKWSTSFWEANRIPLNFLPTSVEMKDNEGNKIKASIVNYNSDGKATGLTLEGQAFLIKDSKIRGA